MNFALPGCRSNFSLLWGTAFPEQLAAMAEARGIRHLGLADHDNLYGVMDFYRACREMGINPLIGVRLNTQSGELHLIAEDYAGYQSLCRLVTKKQLDDAVTPDDLREFSGGLFCLASETAPFGDLFPVYEKRLYLSLSGSETRRADEIIRDFKIKPVANPSVSFLDASDYSLHRLLRAIDTGALAANLNGTPRDSDCAFFPRAHIMQKRFGHMPEAVANGLILADSCRVDFPEHKNLLPSFPDYDGNKSELVRTKALEGLRRKKDNPAGNYLARLDFEMEVINRTGFVDYFLIVSGIVDHCRDIGIPAVGRGSAGGSLVAFALDITQVDPIKEGLYFERFLNEARRDPPDIDLDIDWRRRDDVLEYIYDRYGHERTAMIASYVRFRSRMAVREVAKAAGMSPDEIDNFVKRLPHTGAAEIARTVDKMPQASRAAIDLKRYRPLLEDAARLDNFPRHLGIHCGGIVITPHPLTDYVALERSTKGLVVTQCDMYQAEKLGLIKIDVLGQRGFAVIVDCLEHAREQNGDDFAIPDGDGATEELLQSGKTIGVFQIESPGLRALLRDLKPAELNDITLALALIRPGASDSGMKKAFLDRHHGLEADSFPHPLLESILRETHGVFIYQEQVLLCARAVAGFNLPAADLLRRAITKERQGGRYQRICDRFLDGAIKNGVNRKTALEIFKLLSYFAGFGFCKAHAATYGYLAYQSAYLKTHYPARFMQSVLNNGGGYYPAAVYIAEARRLGVQINPPDINISEEGYTLHGGELFIGLGRIKGLEQETIDQILEWRPFSSFDSFLSQVRLATSEVESLIKVGAFDGVDFNRHRLLWRIRLMTRQMIRKTALAAAKAGDGDIFRGQLMAPEARHLPSLPDVSPLEKFLYEREILGFSATCHPLTLFPNYNAPPITASAGFKDKTPFATDAWLVDIKRIKTREKKLPMVFMTFEDLEETFEVVLFPEVYKKYSELIRKYRFLHVEGTLNIEGGSIAIIADHLSPAPTGLDEKPYI